MTENAVMVPSRLILRGTFLGWDKDTYKDADGARQSKPVLVFARESKRYTQAVQVPAGLVETVEHQLAEADDHVVAVEVFPGNYKALVLIAVLEVI